MQCTSCNGTGKTTVQVTEVAVGGTTHSSFEMDCTDCDGTGEMTPEQQAQRKALDDHIANDWCHCGSTGDQHFHDDVFENGVWVSKHHWTCAACGKITQVG